MNKRAEFYMPDGNDHVVEISSIRFGYISRAQLVAFPEVYPECNTLQADHERVILARHEEGCGEPCDILPPDLSSQLDIEYNILPEYLRRKEEEKHQKKELGRLRLALVALRNSNNIFKIIKFLCDHPILLGDLTLEQLYISKIQAEKALKMPGKKEYDQLTIRFIEELNVWIEKREKEK